MPTSGTPAPLREVEADPISVTVPGSADRHYAESVERNDDGSVVLTRSEARLVRSALFTIERYMDNVWDETVVSAVSGHPVASFRRARRELDDLRASDVADDRQEDLRVAVALREPHG